MQRRENPKRYAENQSDQHGREHKLDRHVQALEHEVHGGLVCVERDSHIAVKNVAEEMQVLRGRRKIESKRVRQLRPFLLIHRLWRKNRDRIAGYMQEYEHDCDDRPQREEGLEEARYDVLRQALIYASSSTPKSVRPRVAIPS